MMKSKMTVGELRQMLAGQSDDAHVCVMVNSQTTDMNTYSHCVWIMRAIGIAGADMAQPDGVVNIVCDVDATHTATMVCDDADPLAFDDDRFNRTLQRAIDKTWR